MRYDIDLTDVDVVERMLGYKMKTQNTVCRRFAEAKGRTNAERRAFVRELYEQSDGDERALATWVFPIIVQDNPTNDDLQFVLDHAHFESDIDSEHVHEAARLLLEREPTLDQLLTVLVEAAICSTDEYANAAWAEVVRRHASSTGDRRLTADDLERILEDALEQREVTFARTVNAIMVDVNSAKAREWATKIDAAKKEEGDRGD